MTARRFYFDTVGHGSQAALLCAWKAFGPEQLVAGSDYPVLLPVETYRQTFHYIRVRASRPRTSTRSSITTPRSCWASPTEAPRAGWPDSGRDQR